MHTTSFIIIMLLLMATGLDFTTAFSAVAAAINNLGPGLGEVAVHKNFADISTPAQAACIPLMMMGRLELFSVIILFSPRLWRK